MKKKNADKVGITFEVKDSVRQLDNVPMPQRMPDGWYWSYDNPKGFCLCQGHSRTASRLGTTWQCI